ncbi:MAG: 6-bladed beta-propeller [Gemmatimonadota bacterium]|jgi:hypothetical protein
MPTPKTIHSLPLVFFAVALMAASCSPEGRVDGWGGTISDSAGIRLVRNPEAGLWGPDEAWTFTEALTIGSDVGDPDYEFGRVTSVDVDPEGLIYVFDGMASEIRVYDQAGMYLRTIGGRGEGPGEFSNGAAGAFLTRDDRLLVPDMGNQRITAMSRDGEFLGSIMVSYASGFPVRWDADRSGNVLVQRRAMGFNEDPDLEAGDPLVRIGPDGEEETLTILPKAETVWMEGAAPRFRYFATEPSWDVGPSGTIRTAMTQVYRIELRNPDGIVRAIVTKPWDQRVVTDGDKARFEALLRAALDRAGLSPDAIDRQIRNLSYGTTFPAFNQIMEGPEGTTVVQQIDALEDIEALDLSEEMSRRLGSRRWDAFDAEGRFLGIFDLPARFTPMVWEPDAVYGRWLDDLDRAHVMKLVRAGVG